MMTDAKAKAAMEEIKRKINLSTKAIKKWDHKITTLREQMQTRETVESSQTLVVKVGDKWKDVVKENQPQQQSVFVASLSIQQLQDMIVNSIKVQ